MFIDIAIAILSAEIFVSLCLTFDTAKLIQENGFCKLWSENIKTI